MVLEWEEVLTQEGVCCELGVCHSSAGEGTRSRSFEEEIGCSRGLEVPCLVTICVLVALGLVEEEEGVYCYIVERWAVVVVGCRLELKTQWMGCYPSAFCVSYE